jgi:Cdc6-like AAA superfamily ATPase
VFTPPRMRRPPMGYLHVHSLTCFINHNLLIVTITNNIEYNIGLIHGPSGSGKTTWLRYFRQQVNKHHVNDIKHVDIWHRHLPIISQVQIIKHWSKCVCSYRIMMDHMNRLLLTMMVMCYHQIKTVLVMHLSD